LNESEASVPTAFLGQRHIQIVEDVEIQMNEQAIKALSPTIHHGARGTRRVGYNGRQPNFCDASILDDLPLKWLRVIIGEKENLV
jgi:hypothetical protein